MQPIESAKEGSPLYAIIRNLTAIRPAPHETIVSEKESENKKEKKKTFFTTIKESFFPYVEIYETIIKPLPQADKQWIALDLFSTQLKDKFPLHTVHNKNLFGDLSIFPGGNLVRPANLFDAINRTKTVYGYAVLGRILAEQLSSISVLRSRQDILKELLTNQSLCNECSLQRSAIVQGESVYLDFFNANQTSLAKAIESRYFKGFFKKFNTYEKCIEAEELRIALGRATWFLPPNVCNEFKINLFMNTVMPMLQIIITSEINPFLSSKTKENINMLLSGYKKIITGGIKSQAEFFKKLNNFDPDESDSTLSIFAKMYSIDGASNQKPKFISTVLVDIKRDLASSLEKAKTNIQGKGISSSPIIGMLLDETNQEHKKAVNILDKLYTAYFYFSWAASSYTGTKHLQVDYDITRYMQTKLITVANTVRALHYSLLIIEKNPVLRANFSRLPALKQLINHPEQLSPQMNQLMNLLNSTTFKGSPSLFSNRGRILAAYQLLQEVKEQFTPALEAAGELDLWLSMVDLINEYKSQDIHYCFAEYKEDALPFISLKTAWNPVVSCVKKIPMSMDLGAGTAVPNLMLVGPHGGGKSTHMKSIAYCIYLAQTLGIACADSCTLTPFTKILTYLNISEDISHGISTFMAEVGRTEDIIKVTRELQPHDRAFLLVDEMFKGTMEREGGHRVYNFGKEVFTNPHTLTILATHFEEPSRLEQDLVTTEGKRAGNFHVGLIETTSGQFIRTFELWPGSNDWWFHDDLKRRRYIEWLITILGSSAAI